MSQAKIIGDCSGNFRDLARCSSLLKASNISIQTDGMLHLLPAGV
jgi:hypothetical protein